jgi:acetolactate synthase-1/2/3 large subunit
VHCAPREPWPDSVFRLRETVRRQTAADPMTAAAAAILDAVEGAWPAEAAVVCDMAVAGYWVGGYAAMPRPRRLQYPVGWGTLGYALPASIGPAAAGVRTLAVVGDGGLAMGVGELATLAQERLPVTVLLVDDGGYGMLRYDQQRFGHAERGVDLAGPDWLALAEAYGIPAAAAGSPGRLHAALASAASADGPNLVLLRGALEPPRTTSPRWGDPV